jgi:ubiquinone/menaquinone biosynthesis C-methylase UbiE
MGSARSANILRDHSTDAAVVLCFEKGSDMNIQVMQPDYAAIKQKQQATWASGDYSVIGTTLQIVGEKLCEAIDLRAGERVLDVAAGNGNATLAAARRYALVTSTDYVGELLERGRERAAAEHLTVSFQEADVEALPYGDGMFDAVVSTFGVMFAPNQEKSASEMSRVTRKGGRIGHASWTPESFIGKLFKKIGKHVKPPAGVLAPSLWGSEERMKELFPGHKLEATKEIFNFRYKSPEHWLQVFRTFYGPTNKAFAALDANGQAELEADMLELAHAMNRGGKHSMVVPGEYLQAVLTKK